MKSLCKKQYFFSTKPQRSATFSKKEKQIKLLICKHEKNKIFLVLIIKMK